jgi:hypothetical protein
MLIVPITLGVQLIVGHNAEWFQHLLSVAHNLLQLPNTFEVHINNSNFPALFGKASLAFYLLMTLLRLVTKKSLTLSVKGKVKILVIVPIIVYAAMMFFLSRLPQTNAEAYLVWGVFGVATIVLGLVYAGIDAVGKVVDRLLSVAEAGNTF